MRIVLLFGGPGSEHEVSLSSAKNILENIDRDRFEVLEVFVTKDKKYKIEDSLFEENEGINEIKNKGIDVVFPIIHGKYGEDGELQEKLESVGIKFVGSSSKVSSVTIDKNKTNEVLNKHSILIPKSKIISKENCEIDFVYPIVVKPKDEGSSVDLFKFENENDYKNSLDKIFKNHKEMLVQEFIEGREFTCGVIEINKKTTALVATEVILTKGGLFDYEAKYTENGCQEITPAKVDESLMNRTKETALICHQVLECKSISRTDMILKGNNLYVLEINTVPGMTKTSFIPAQAKVCGYSMKELITLLIESV